MTEHLKKLKVNFRMLAAATLICFCFVGFRVLFAGRTGYIFLIWNLFLAWMPLLFADAAELFHKKGNTVRFGVFSFLWVIFFPNAPYIVTDFKHLMMAPAWYDFIMISAFAATGAMLGLCSLQVMKRIIFEKFGVFWSRFGMVMISLLAGFGIYLGRYLRWNSWDIFFNPHELFADITNRLTQPLSYPLTWFISLLFAALVLFSHLVFSRLCEYKHGKKD